MRVKNRLKIIPVPKQIVTGVTTYKRDFDNIVLSEIAKHYIFVKENELADAVFSFSTLQKPLLHSMEYVKAPIYQILHNDGIAIHEKFIGEYTNHRFVTHYTHFYRWAIEKHLKCFFIPMSIDTEWLPYRHNENKKIIYFSNIYDEKNKTIFEMKEMGLEFDTMSQGKFNGNGDFNWNEAIEIVSEYEYGIGVGRSAIEMLAMGMKVIIAGKKIGGVISNNEELTKHWATNCNSVGYSNYKGNLLDEIKNLKFIIAKENRKIFDMRNYLKNYKLFFNIE